MEKLFNKIRNFSILISILAILSLTWFFIDYMALKKIWLSSNVNFSFEWLMVILSAIPFGLLIIAIFIFLFIVFRTVRKIKLEFKKRAEKET